MVPNVAATGKSFKGAALYYLHDKRAEGDEEALLTSERVAWTQTRNLATDNPETAWKIMAATAVDQDRLKAEAGIKKSGRKSAQSVYAYSIAWHPEEQGRISRAEMLRAADESIRAIGAEGHQVLLVAHNDTPHPHVHVIINRVSPVDGRMLGTSNDFNKLDAWALAYRKERGEELLYCPSRVEKEKAKRAKADGESVPYVRGKSRTPQSMVGDFAAARTASPSATVRERERQKALNQKLSAHGRAQYQDHRKAWLDLSAGYNAKKRDIVEKAASSIERTKEGIKDQYRPSWRNLFQQQWKEQRAFELREKRIGGKIENALSAIAHRRQIDPDSSKGFLTTAINYLVSQKARSAALQKRHERDRRQLSGEQSRATKDALVRIKSDRTSLLKRALATFQYERSALIEKQASEKEELKLAWRQRKAEMARAFDAIRRSEAPRTDADIEAELALDRGTPRAGEHFTASAQRSRGARTRTRRRKAED